MLFIVSMIAVLAPSELPLKERSFHRQHGVYFELGLNWSRYTRSNVRFRGRGYDFRIQNAGARDAPIADIHLDNMQYTYRLGVNLSDRFSVSLGLDHMKYLLRREQNLRVRGTVEAEYGAYAGEYRGESVPIGTPGALVERVEHTDGLNLLEAAVTYIEDLYVSPQQRHAVAIRLSAFVGMAIPVTDSTVLGNAKTGNIKPGGYSFSWSAALRGNLFRKFYAEAELKSGFVHILHFELPAGGRGSGKLGYFQPNFSLGLEWI